MHFTTLALATLAFLAAANAATDVMSPVHETTSSSLRSRHSVIANTGMAIDGQPSTNIEQPPRVLILPSTWLVTEKMYLNGIKGQRSLLNDIIEAYAPSGELTRSGWDQLLRDHPELNTPTIQYENLACNGRTVTWEIFAAFLQYKAITFDSKTEVNKRILPRRRDDFTDRVCSLITYRSKGTFDWESFRDVVVPKMIFDRSTKEWGYMHQSAWKGAIKDLSSFLGVTIKPDDAYNRIVVHRSISRDNFVSFALFSQFAGNGQCITAQAWPDQSMALAGFANISGDDFCVDFSEWNKYVLAQK